MQSSATDTSPEAEEAHFELLRKAGPERRAQVMRSLSTMVLSLAWQGVSDSFPNAGDRELRIQFIARVYGEPLAEKYGRYLERTAG